MNYAIAVLDIGKTNKKVPMMGKALIVLTSTDMYLVIGNWPVAEHKQRDKEFMFSGWEVEWLVDHTI